MQDTTEQNESVNAKINPNLSDKALKDYNLVKNAIDNGDQKAYAELMSRYKDSIYFMLLKMVNNRDDADDLTIEAFGKAFKNIRQYLNLCAEKIVRSIFNESPSLIP